jgi:hypothetical protein
MNDQHALETTLVVLISLAIATLLASWYLTGPFANAVALGIAALKGRRILLDFLGLRTAPAVWRVLVTTWTVGLASFAWATSLAGC